MRELSLAFRFFEFEPIHQLTIQKKAQIKIPFSCYLFSRELCDSWSRHFCSSKKAIAFLNIEKIKSCHITGDPYIMVFDMIFKSFVYVFFAF